MAASFSLHAERGNIEAGFVEQTMLRIADQVGDLYDRDRGADPDQCLGGARIKVV